MITIDDIINRIRNYARAHKLSARGFATRAGCSEGALRGLHRDDWSPNINTLRKLEEVILGRGGGDNAPCGQSTIEKREGIYNEQTAKVADIPRSYHQGDGGADG